MVPSDIGLNNRVLNIVISMYTHEYANILQVDRFMVFVDAYVQDSFREVNLRTVEATQ